MSYPILDTINNPQDLRRCSLEELTQLTQELKSFLIDSVSSSGGHFASSLGALELTVALHYVFDTPEDIIVWDVGHQSYIHKILTERKKKLHSIRSFGGLCGFPNREESVYDSFSVGHAGTAISAALGMAVANRRHKKNNIVIAVVGDGGLTAGMAFEALNHAGELKEDLIIIQNDNQMSISANVGALNYSMNAFGDLYKKIKQQGKKLVARHPIIRQTAKEIDRTASLLIEPHNLFTALGCSYHGPVDGHHLTTLIESLRNLKQQSGVRVLHAITKKGYGYKLAEQDPINYHGVTPFNKATGIIKKKKGARSYSQVLGSWLEDHAAGDPQMTVITPAMIEGSGLRAFAEHYPQKLFDVGIAEQHAITLAAGMACQGLKPIVAIYATFLQRGYDQCLHDVLLQNLDVLFAIDRAGLVGGDGATHHGIYDIGFLLPLPHSIIIAPSDEAECYRSLTTGYQHKGPVFVRYPRGSVTPAPLTATKPFPIGSSRILKRGSNLAILGFGPLVHQCHDIAKKLKATLVDMRFVKPLDHTTLQGLLKNHTHLVTVEDHVVSHGAGAAVSQYLHAIQATAQLKTIGIPDTIIEHGDPAALYQSIALNSDGILHTIEEWLTSSTKR